MSHKHQFTSRTKARKRAADVVYEADQRGMGRNATVLRDLLRERKVITAALTPLPDYSIRIIEGVADELYRIDRLIDTHARTGLDRIPAVDRAVLRVAIWEMLSNSEEVPPVIAIAILDAIRQDIESPSWSRRSSEADSGQESDEELSADELTELDDLLNEY